MIKQKWLLVLCSTLMMVLFSPGCAKKGMVDSDDMPMSSFVSDEDIENGDADSDSGQAMGLQTVRFPLDSSSIVGDGESILENNYKVLSDNPSLNVQIEGHCDERGGIQYNIALGERRANSLRRRLIRMGISGGRIETISYGKSRLLSASHYQNRRGNFRITSR